MNDKQLKIKIGAISFEVKDVEVLIGDESFSKEAVENIIQEIKETIKTEIQK